MTVRISFVHLITKGQFRLAYAIPLTSFDQLVAELRALILNFNLSGPTRPFLKLALQVVPKLKLS